MSQPGRVLVDPARLGGWIDRFTASHGEVAWTVARGEDGAAEAWVGRAADGSWARLEGWGRPEGEWSAAQVDARATWLRAPGPLFVLLLRKGGYAVAVTTEGGELVSHKVGTRYVQGRTAAGGWSQRRYARRRQGQVDELVGAVVEHGRRVLDEGEGILGSRALLLGEVEGRRRDRVQALVRGGDPALTDRALGELAQGPLSRVANLPRREFRDLPDPRRSVLDEAVRRAVAVQVEVLNAQ